MPQAVDVCVRIEFGNGTVLRYANVNLMRQDGATVYAWEGRCKTPSMSWDLGPQDQAFANLGTVQIEIDNTDGALNAYLPGGASYSAIRWPEARIDVYTGGTDGGNITAMLKEFSGSIPIGGLRTSPTAVLLSVNDLRETYNVTFGAYTVTSTAYPSALADDVNQTVARVIGDYTGIDADQAFRIRCTNTSTYQFKVNDGPYSATGLVVYKDGVAITPASTDTTNGLLTISSGDYNAASVYTAKFEGYQDGVANCPTSWHPVDVIYWLLNTIGGVPVGDIDTASFTAAKAAGDSFTVRRYVTDQTTVFQEVNRIAFECGYDIFVNRSGQFEIQWFAPIISATAPSLTERNIIDGTFATELDPDQIYCNRITVNYNDLYGGYSAETYTEDTTEQTTFGKVVEKNYVFYWLYSLSEITTSIQRKLFFWKRMPEVVDIAAVWESSTTSDAVYSAFLADGIRITLYRFSAAEFWIRRCGLDLLSGTIGFRAVNMDSIPNIGVWDDNTLPRPGYWGDVSGVPYDSYWW